MWHPIQPVHITQMRIFNFYLTLSRITWVGQEFLSQGNILDILIWCARIYFSIPRKTYNIGITHVFSCINICQVPRKLFEHEATRLSVQISSEGPGKCYCNEITMDDCCSCITYNSNGKLWWKCPKAPYKLFKCNGQPTWPLVQNVVYSDSSCAMTLWRRHKILKCYLQGDNVTSLNVT